MKAIVIGAGIVGSSVAYRLAEAGANVTVLEARRPGAGTSSTSYAWVNACEKLTSREYFELNFAGVKAHAALAEDFPGSDWYHRPGIIQWQDAGSEAGAADVEDADEKVALLKGWGYEAELLSHVDLRELEPEINPAAVGNSRVIYYPSDGWVDAVSYIGSILGVAQSRYGATVLRGAIVTGIETTQDVCSGVRLADGSTHSADVVINCAGRWANEAISDRSFHMPLAPTYGIIAYTNPIGVALRRGLRTPLVNLRPDGAGRFLLRSNELDRLLETDEGALPSHPQALELMRRACRTIPTMEGGDVEAVRIAVRPIPKDGYSALGAIPGLRNYYLAVTHSGVTLAPFIGVAITDELLHGRERPELAAFRPARFFH